MNIYFDIPDKFAAAIWNRIATNPNAKPLDISYAQLKHNVACYLSGDEIELLIYDKRPKKKPVVKKAAASNNYFGHGERGELVRLLFRIGINAPKNSRIGNLKLFLRDGKCLDCGTKENLTKDHILPSSKGGLNNFDNYQTLCADCNSYKGNKIIQKHLDRIPEIIKKNTELKLTK